MLGELSQGLTYQGFHLGLGKQDRQAPNRHALLGEDRQGKAQVVQQALLSLQGFKLKGRGLKGQRLKQLLHGPRWHSLETLVNNALMGGMHINQNKPLGVLRKNENAMQLGKGKA